MYIDSFIVALESFAYPVSVLHSSIFVECSSPSWFHSVCFTIRHHSYFRSLKHVHKLRTLPWHVSNLKYLFAMLALLLVCYIISYYRSIDNVAHFLSVLPHFCTTINWFSFVFCTHLSGSVHIQLKFLLIILCNNELFVVLW